MMDRTEKSDVPSVTGGAKPIPLSTQFVVYGGSMAHPSSYLRISGTLSLAVKQTRREAHHLLPPSIKIKNECSCISTAHKSS
jgi:hypothetical protein